MSDCQVDVYHLHSITLLRGGSWHLSLEKQQLLEILAMWIKRHLRIYPVSGNIFDTLTHSILIFKLRKYWRMHECAWKMVVMPGLKCVIISGPTPSWRPVTNGVLRMSRIFQCLHQWCGWWDKGCVPRSKFQIMLSKGKWLIPSDKALTQKDFEKHENCTKNFLKFSREKCQVLCWGEITPHIRTGWELNVWDFIKGNLDAKMCKEATVCCHYRWCKQPMELHQEKQIQGNYYLLYSSLVRPVLDPPGCQEP